MSNIVAVHSFRGGTGKSNLTANLATQVAMGGYRVAIVDTDISSPGIHAVFGFDSAHTSKTLNDYLWGNATIEEVAYPLREQAQSDPERAFLADLEMWLIPSSIRTGAITRILREGYDVTLLNEGFYTLLLDLELDYLFIDTHPGLSDETLLSIALSNMLLLLLRPDQQDFQGTAVTVDVAQRLDVPHLRLVMNKVSGRYDLEKMRADVAETFGVPVAGMLPLSEDVAFNGSRNVFSALHPAHPWTQALQEVVDAVLAIHDEDGGA